LTDNTGYAYHVLNRMKSKDFTAR